MVVSMISSKRLVRSRTCGVANRVDTSGLPKWVNGYMFTHTEASREAIR